MSTSEARREARSVLERCCARGRASGCGEACGGGARRPPPPLLDDPGVLPTTGVLGETVLRDLAAISGADARPTNAVRVLGNGNESLGTMVELVRRARSDVRLENFIFRADAVGRLFAEELRARAQRDVRVRVLHDPMGAVMARRPPVDVSFRGSKVSVRLFNVPMTRRRSRRAGRDHRKLVVADGGRLVIGGICLADPWAGNCIRHCTWRDSALYVEGPVASHAAAAFEDTWRHGWRLPGTPKVAGVGFGGRPVRAAGGIPARMVEDLGATRRTLPLLVRAIDASEQEVLITNPYFIPPPSLEKALLRAVARGVAVSAILPGRSNHRVAALSSEHRLGRLLDGGVEVHLWKGTMIHAKSVVVDRVWTLVGSSNLDSLSLISNAELNVEVHGGAVGEAMAMLFEEDRVETLPLTFSDWHARPVPRRLAGRLASRFARWQ